MITHNDGHLPQTCLSYLAFRIALRETLERITLARQFDTASTTPYGFLTEVPFLQGVAPHVQIDLLGRTWTRHRSRDKFRADILDEAVTYAVCETAATLVESSPSDVHRFLRGGPLQINVRVDPQFAKELRSFHHDLCDDGDFLLISQFEDLSPRESRTIKAEFGLDSDRLEPMFDVLGRWQLEPEFQQNLSGLLTVEERSLLEPLYGAARVRK